MAATYVQIQRDTFENWIFTQCPVFERVEGKQGVYLIPVSDDVVLYISTSIGREDTAVAKGRGACHMKLQGRHNGQCLNRKDLGQTRFNRTTGWAKNWAAGIERLFAAYEKHSDFYDQRGRETQPEYAARVKAEMANLRGSFFDSLRDQMDRGRWLSAKQMGAIERALEKVSQAPAASPEVNRAIALRDKADQVNDVWVANFAKDMADTLRRGGRLSDRQEACLSKNLTKYGISA
jgi:hypothetical protein